MQWVGLTPLELLATLAGFGAAVALLYLLRQAPRRAVVPALALWNELLGNKDASALWTRLRRLWSLLLALLVVALVSFAISDLRRRGDTSRRAVLLLVDASASMAATDERPTRLAAAKARARSVLDALAPSDRAIVVQLDAQATPLGSLSEDGVELSRQLAALRQTDLAGDLEPGIRFGLDVLAGEKQPEIVLVSDGNLRHVDGAARALAEQKNVRFRFLRVGTAERNLAITSFSVRRYPLDKTHHESIVTVTSFAPADERVKLTIRAGGALLYEETLTVPKHVSVTRALRDLAGADDMLEASIAPERGPDPLSSDDRAYATLPPRSRSRVLVVSEDNRYLEAGLLLDEYLDVDDVAPAQYERASGYDVVVFDRALPKSAPGVPALYLALPRGDTSPLRVTGELARPYFERVEREHPIVRLTALSDVNVARAARVEVEPGDRVIASTARKEPLIVQGERAGAPFVALTFDVRESDLPLRAAFPLLLLSAIDFLAGEEGATIARSEAGDVMRVALPEGQTRAELKGQDGTREILRAQRGEIRVARDRAGVYTLSSAGASARLAVTVPAAFEGALSPRERVVNEPEATAPHARSSGFVGERPWPLLLLLALLLLAIEWLTFHRRWTV